MQSKCILVTGSYIRSDWYVKQFVAYNNLLLICSLFTELVQTMHQKSKQFRFSGSFPLPLPFFTLFVSSTFSHIDFLRVFSTYIYTYRYVRSLLLAFALRTFREKKKTTPTTNRNCNNKVTPSAVIFGFCSRISLQDFRGTVFFFKFSLGTLTSFQHRYKLWDIQT